MHVLYFHQHFTTPNGSTGTRSYEMARALIARGHSVHVVCGSYVMADTGLSGTFVDGRRTGFVDGIEVTEFSLRYSNSDGFVRRVSVFLAFALRSMKIAVTAPCDLVFATSTPLTAGIPGIAARWIRQRPFVFEVRDLWPELPKAMGVITNPAILSMMSALEWLSYRSARACIGLAPGIVEGIRARSSGRAEVALIPNGCDIDQFAESDVPPLRPEGVSPDDFVAIFTGTHGKANGLDAVLDAAAALQGRGRSDIKIVLIGEGGEKSRLVRRAEEEALHNCLFLDKVPKRALAGYLGSADVGLMILANVPAFYRGTSPNKFFDYLAMGKPVVTNYPGWLGEIIEECGIGRCVPPDQPDALADALVRMANERESLPDMGARALALARSRFDRRLLAVEFVDFLERHRVPAENVRA